MRDASGHPAEHREPLALGELALGAREVVREIGDAVRDVAELFDMRSRHRRCQVAPEDGETAGQRVGAAADREHGEHRGDRGRDGDEAERDADDA